MWIKPGFLDLTYCTNIHPAEGWENVFSNVRKYAPRLKERLSPGGRFGVGLRISAAEAEQLRHCLDDFKGFLDSHGLYVSLLNGFPFASFHGGTVKAAVFTPDWRERARVHYTLDLIDILNCLLPDGVEGGISTVPLSYKRWVPFSDDTAWKVIVLNLVQVTEAMARVRRETGRIIHLDIEPEPDGLLENTQDVVSFFRDHLLPRGAPLLAASLGITQDQAWQDLLDHIRVCFDTCHFAVEYEEPGEAFRSFAKKAFASEGFRSVPRSRCASPLQVLSRAEPHRN